MTRKTSSNNDNEQQMSMRLPWLSQVYDRSISTYNSQSMATIDQQRSPYYLTGNLDTYSFADIELASSIVTDKNDDEHSRSYNRLQSILSRNLSSITNDLSTCSTRSLLRTLVDKAQLLDQYYNEILNKKANHRSLMSLSSSSSLLLLSKSCVKQRSNSLSRSLSIHCNSSNMCSSMKCHRHGHEKNSSDNSRFDLYVDEDNVLRELVRFNTDIDFILSRLKVEGECEQQSTTAILDRLSLTYVHETNDDSQRPSAIIVDHSEQIDHR
jgi:hypothetical protein